MKSNGIAVVGGGLGGLAVATLLARRGRQVTVFEKAGEVGGRARTQARGDFRFNQGPHALYRGCATENLLRELDVKFSGGNPPVAGFMIDDGRPQTAPSGLVSLLSTTLFGLSGKFEAAKLLATLPRLDVAPLMSTPISAWLDTINNDGVRRLLAGLVRLATYANAPAQSAGAALAQLRLGMSPGVTYIDGGWQSLVDGLRERATAAGVQIVPRARVEVIAHDEAVRAVRLADGSEHPVSSVVIAAGPGEVAALLPDVALVQNWAAQVTPVRAASLDLALSRLPRPRATFGLGLDRPTYFSVHSASAQLAPPGNAMLHVAKYLPVDASEPTQEAELEAVVDLLQPGWREVLVDRRFLPDMVVSHAVVTAAGGALGGRPGPAVPGVRGAYVVGDWVGPEGMLADASAASARQAAGLIAAT